MSKSRQTEAQMIGALETTRGSAEGGGRGRRIGGVEAHDLRLATANLFKMVVVVTPQH